jgi:ATP-binding cassette, subfamily B, bacterial PglK
MNTIQEFIMHLKEIYYLSFSSFKKLIYIYFLVCLGTVFEIIGIGLIIPFFSTLFDKTSSTYINALFEFINIDPPNNALAFIAILIFLSLVLKTIVMIYIQYLQTKFCQETTIRLRRKILKSFFDTPYSNYKKQKRASLIYSTHDLSARFGSILMNVIKAFSDLVFALAIIIFLSTIDIYFLLSFLALMVCWLIIYDIAFGNKLKIYGEEVNVHNKKIISISGENFDGYKEIILLRCRDWFENRLFITCKRLAKTLIKHSLIYFFQHQILEIITAGILLGSIVVFVLSGEDPTVIVAKLGVFAFGILRLKPIAVTISRAISDFRFNRDVINILTNDLSAISNLNISGQQKLKVSLKEDEISFEFLELDNVTYIYDLDDIPILENVSLKINKGDIVGIKGESGSGKTTLLDIISGMLTPSSGNIFVNGYSAEKASKIISMIIGYIPQSTFIIDGTVLTNVAIGVEKSSINLGKVKDSLLRAGLKNFVNDLEREVGEAGRFLSGGQIQRLSIARQFYNNNEILILDESTNALDKETEEEIIKDLKNMKERPTIIIVSHNLRYKEFCNKIFEIEKGILRGPISS